MGDLALDLKSHGEEENHHQDVVDQLLHVHVAGEHHVYRSVLAEEMDAYVGLQNAVIELLGERKVGEEHRQYYAGKQKDALEPGLL